MSNFLQGDDDYEPGIELKGRVKKIVPDCQDDDDDEDQDEEEVEIEEETQEEPGVVVDPLQEKKKRGRGRPKGAKSKNSSLRRSRVKKRKVMSLNEDGEEIEVEVEEEQPKTFICLFCSEHFESGKELTHHYLTHMDPEDPLSCPVCILTNVRRTNFKRYEDKKALMLHITNHSGEKPLGCPVEGCQRTFVSKYDLKKHIPSHDLPPDVKARPYMCHICPKSFEYAHVLKAHLRRHTGERPYKCNQCDRAFVQSGALKQHYKVHTGKIGHLTFIQFINKYPVKNVTWILNSHGNPMLFHIVTNRRQFGPNPHQIP